MSATEYSSILDALQNKLQQGNLSAPEVAQGARACFIACQYSFFEHRTPTFSQEQIVSLSDSLIEEVYEQEHINPQTASPVMLRHAVEVLNSRFEFMQDPEIAQHHHEVITSLFSKLANTVPAKG